MTSRSFALMTGATVALLSDTAVAEDIKVVTRIDGTAAPTALTPVAATPVEGAFTQNVVAAGERIFAEGNSMLKAVTVPPVGVPGTSARKLGSAEGGTNHEQTEPNSLSSLSAGIAASLFTSLGQAVEVMGLAVDDMKAEVKVDFRWQDPFTPDWAGFTDLLTANIVIESDEAPEKLAALKVPAMKGWIAGEGLAHATDIDIALVANGTNFDTLSGAPGLIPDPVSNVGGFTLPQKSGTPVLATIDPGEDVGMDGPMGSDMPASIEVSVVVVVTSAGDAEHPDLQRINVRAMQDNDTGWELYADDNYGTEGLDKAKSSLDYRTAGTFHCPMSQLAITPMALDLDIPDFRVERQFSFRQDAAATAALEGPVDSIQARVVVDSDAPMEAFESYFGLSTRLCFAGEAWYGEAWYGEAWSGETPIASDLYVNGALFD